MTPNEQLLLWLMGQPVHDFEYNNGEGQCCPDFSCCYPLLLEPTEKRKKFVLDRMNEQDVALAEIENMEAVATVDGGKPARDASDNGRLGGLIPPASISEIEAVEDE